jgi:hypothetical protein
MMAVLSGLIVGSLFGYTPYHTFFFIIVPIIGGGIGEGILPLSLAYSAILGQTPDVYVAQLAPAAVVGNIFAIICAGSLARLGRNVLRFREMACSRGVKTTPACLPGRRRSADGFSSDGRRIDGVRVFHRRRLV